MTALALVRPASRVTFAGPSTRVEAVTHIGITGTRRPLTRAQAQALMGVMREIGAAAPATVWLHHGACTGADSAAHWIARTLRWKRHGHPGHGRNGDSPWRAEAAVMNTLDVCEAALPYGSRNRVIASWAHRMLACPLHDEHHSLSTRSGTWQTVRMARELLIPVTVIMPDGSIEPEGD